MNLILRYVLTLLCAGVLVASIARLTVDLLSKVYKQGYEKGWNEAGEWWCRAGQHIEEMGKEVRDEERWP